jgi:CRISPR-associated protein (TIGR03986 family)
MPEGTIARFFQDRGFGFIRQDAGGKDIFFHISDVQGLADHEVRPGTRVLYETESSPRGPRAKPVRPAGATTPSRADRLQAGTHRFLNPYNFVRPLQAVHPERAPLLGRCLPPPHDRYLGLNGRITCKLTAVTPLFVADADDVSEGPSDHYHLKFFRDDGETPAIPGTSLRGSIRSVFEAATNSCFSVFGGNKRLSYHLPPPEALKLVPARAVKDGDQWYLELLTGTTPLAAGQRPQGAQYAAWVQAYRPLQASRTLRSAPGTPYARRSPISLAGWQHNQPCQAIVEEVEHPRARFSFWNVVELAREDASPLKAGPGQKHVTGYLCITNQNIENKHDERLFFYDGGDPQRVSLNPTARQRYRELIADYQERHADDVQKREKRSKDPGRPLGSDPGFSWFVYERTDEDKLQNGDLVYAMLSRRGRMIQVEYIVPVSVPRVGYDQTVEDRLDPDMARDKSPLHKCEEYNALCPACRTFGWVWGSGDPDRQPPADESIPIAYAGRVRFHHATLEHSTGTLDDIPLAILSSPKPTTTRFYLKPAGKQKPKDGQEDGAVDYSQSANQELRGRKVYRHHGEQLSDQEYRRAGDVRDDQNRTVHGVQKAGSTFEFEVDFENLAPLELGALLWALEIEGWHHCLGMGKPLGFGSAQVEVTGMELMWPETRYTGLGSGGESALDQKGVYVKAFQAAMQERYGKDFHALDNIRDLRSLLAESPDVPVHYPRSTAEPQPDGRNYEWFMGNKRSGRNAGPRYTLPLAPDDEEGFPLLDRFGEEVS